MLVAPGPAGAADRGYEQVSPVDKAGLDVFLEIQGILNYNMKAARDGGIVSFASRGAFAGAPSGNVLKAYVARRGAERWSTSSSDAVSRAGVNNAVGVTAYSDDFTHALVSGKGPALAAGATDGVDNFYVRDLRSGAYQAVTLDTMPNAFPNSDLYFVGGSDGFDQVVFEDGNAHGPLAPPFTRNLYSWSPTGVRLVGILPDGTPSPEGALGGAAPDPFGTSRFNAVSDDGTHIYFTTPVSRQIYLRLSGTETRAVSASQKTVPDPGPAGATFWGASNTGDRAIFTSIDQLVDGDTNGTIDLYRYVAATGRLDQLTSGADVYQVFGMSQDASYVYFMAVGALLPGGDPGDVNVYVWHDGQISLVAPWGGVAGGSPGDDQSARVSADGTAFAFLSTDRLTDVDTQGIPQAYVYDVATGKVSCASCPTGGEAPEREAILARGRLSGPAFYDPISYQSSLSADGQRLFFSTASQLVESDVNQAVDTYEYSHGVVSLISGGRGASDSYFVDASANGDDAYFVTREQLAPTDRDKLADLYDSRVGGGFAVPPSPGPACVGDDCRPGQAAGATLPEPATAVSQGEGNESSDETAGTVVLGKITAQALRQAARNGRLRLSVRSDVGGVVKVTLTSRIGGNQVIVGKASTRVRAGKSVAVVVRMSGSARRALKKSGRLRVGVELVHSQLAGEETRTISLKASRVSRRRARRAAAIASDGPTVRSFR